MTTPKHFYKLYYDDQEDPPEVVPYKPAPPSIEEKEIISTPNKMAAAVAAPAAGSAASNVIGSIVKEGAHTIFGALGNLMNEKYEKRKKTLDEELAEKQLKVREDLDKDLNKARTKDEIDRAYAASENDLKKINVQFQNDMAKLDREMQQRNSELDRSYDDKNISRTDLQAAINYMKDQISNAQTQQTKTELLRQLTTLYQALGGVRGTGRCGTGVYNKYWTGKEWKDKSQETTTFKESMDEIPGVLPIPAGGPIQIIPPKRGEQYSVDKKIKSLFSL